MGDLKNTPQHFIMKHFQINRNVETIVQYGEYSYIHLLDLR